MDEDFPVLVGKRLDDRIHDLMAKSKKSTDPVQAMCLERAAHELIALKDYIDAIS